MKLTRPSMPMDSGKNKEYINAHSVGCSCSNGNIFTISDRYKSCAQNGYDNESFSVWHRKVISFRVAEFEQIFVNSTFLFYVTFTFTEKW